ncbi:ABC transporter permease [Aceticella autotrophica]|uniref:ABC transporter permease n=1 Tax=Aceticella autotrophica TaxID=2755338 RepID=UPI002542DC09|nr:ABC transporter permease [Aceticella autotrophica]
MKCVRCERESSVSVSIIKTLIDYINASIVITEMEIKKLRHDPTELFTRAIQPVLWLLIFGQALSHIRAIPTGNVNYQTFMTPGILAQSMMFVSIFYGINIIWDKDQGVLQKLIALPVPRLAFVTGKAFSAGIRAISQVLIIILLALIIGIKIQWSFAGIILSILTIICGAVFFSSLSMSLAAIVKSKERFMGFGQVITMPLFFASNAIYPISIMPLWLQVLSRINPLSYIVELLRNYLLNGYSINTVLDWITLICAIIFMQIIAGILFPYIVS